MSYNNNSGRVSYDPETGAEIGAEARGDPNEPTARGDPNEPTARGDPNEPTAPSFRSMKMDVTSGALDNHPGIFYCTNQEVVVDLSNFIEALPLPKFYLLEKNSHKKFPNSDFEKTISRMKDCIYKLSMRIDGFQGKNKIRLTTVDDVPLVVCFWQSKNSEEFLVHIQKAVMGRYTLLFLKAKSMIFKFLEGETPPVAAADHQYNERMLQQVENLVRIEQAEQAKREQAKPCSTASQDTAFLLKKVVSLLKNISCIPMGFEILSTIVDPNKSGMEVATLASRVVLMGSGSEVEILSSEAKDLSSQVLRLALRAEKQEEEFNFMALTIVVVAMEVVGKGFDSGNTTITTKDVFLSFWENSSPLEPLTSMVKNYAVEPHRAYMAVRAINCLCAVRGEGGEFLFKGFMDDLLSIDGLVQQKVHYLLHSEVEILRGLLRSGGNDAM